MHTHTQHERELGSIAIAEQGPKSNKKATEYVRHMLAAFGLSGRFTLTTNFTDEAGRPEREGIKIRQHSHCGVMLEIQPESGSSRFYESWLSWPGHQPNELASLLHEKIAGQKRYRIDEWKEPATVTPFPVPSSTEYGEVAIDQEPETEESVERDESLQGYTKNPDDRNTVLLGVYEAHSSRSFTADQFVSTMQQKCRIKANSGGLKNLLRRLMKMGFFNSRTNGQLETFRLSETAIEFLSDSGLIEFRPPVAAPERSEETALVAARVLVLAQKAEQYRNARLALGPLTDEISLAKTEIQMLEDYIGKARKRLSNLEEKKRNLNELVENPEFAEASGEITSLLQGNTGLR